MRRYDKYGRIIQGKETIADEEFQTAYTYNDKNKIASVTYPSGFLVSLILILFKVLGGAHSFSFDLSQYPQGVYLMRLLVNGQAYTEKVAKK